MVFRFEYYENVISKHHLSKVDWRQCAVWGWNNNLNRADTTIASVRQIDEHTVEIIKRKDQNKGMMYKWGFDQTGLFERVTINRKECTVAVDRMDGNWWIPQPFLGQRDLFYIENKDKQAILDGKATSSRMAFVRHNFWLHKVYKLNTVVWSNASAWSYKRAFKAQ